MVKLKRVTDLLEMLTRPTTSDGEALNAARALGRMANQNGGFERMFEIAQGAAPAQAPLSFNEKRRQMSSLEDQITDLRNGIDERDHKISQLLAENAGLRREAEAMKNAVRDRVRTKSDGTMSYRDFAFRVSAILGKSWRQHFAAQTEFDELALERARIAGVVQSEMVDALQHLSPPKQAQFSISDVRDIRKWAKSHSEDIIAAKATEKFDRIITEQMIKKLRVDLRQGNAEYRDKSYGGPLPSARTARNAAFKWDDHPELERMVCDNSIRSNRRSATEMAALLSERTGMKINDGQVKQRVDNAVPPTYMLKQFTGDGTLTWPELWYLGSRLRKRAWKQAVFNYLGVAPIAPGDSLESIPRDRVDGLRRMVAKELR